ncbi:MAG: hypothetical protein U9O89_06000 [Thermoproteota archaeon]|nr:hypothetical protein [Thermoproteota archaeon]
MKRWSVFSGRLGTVLLAVGFALLLISLIPPARIGFSTAAVTTLSPRTFHYPWTRVATPQRGVEITAKANGTLDIYLLDVSHEYLFQWVLEQNHDVLPYNLSMLEDFLAAHPNCELEPRRQIQDDEIEFGYTPTKVTNVTLVLANPTAQAVEVDFEIRTVSLIAERKRVLTPAQWMIPVGFILTVPWLISWWKERKRQLF